MRTPRLLVFACPVDALIKARDLGIQIVNFDLAERITVARREAVAELHEIDWLNPASYLALAQRLHLEKPFDGVVSFGEGNVFASALVGEVLGLKSNSLRSVVIAKDKALMRHILHEAGVSATAFESIRTAPESNRAKAEELALRLKLPLILKPQDGSGSSQVQRCEDVEQVADYLDRFFSRNKSGAVCLAEEYLDGPEISVETITFEGRHEILAITEKQTSGAPAYIETGHFIPAQLRELGEVATQSEVFKMVNDTLNAIGHRLGPGHTELKLTKGGPRVIETHTRPGGDGITTLIQLVTGVDVFVETFRYLAFGSSGSIPVSTPNAAASSQFLLSRGGICPQENGSSLFSRHPAVVEYALMSAGESLPLSVDSHTRAGHFILRGESRQQLDEAILSLRTSLSNHFEGAVS